MAEQKLPEKAQETEMKREKVRVVPIKYGRPQELADPVHSRIRYRNS